jgi:hypothetical protein
MASSPPAPHWSCDSIGVHLASTWRPVGVFRDICHVGGTGDSARIRRFWGQFLILGGGGEGVAWVAILAAPSHTGNSYFLPLSP